MYEQICQALDNEEVKEETLVIYGTMDTVENGTAWTVYTDQGEFGFEGLGMSKYVDTKIRVLERQDHPNFRKMFR